MLFELVYMNRRIYKAFLIASTNKILLIDECCSNDVFFLTGIELKVYKKKVFFIKFILNFQEAKQQSGILATLG